MISTTFVDAIERDALWPWLVLALPIWLLTYALKKSRPAWFATKDPCQFRDRYESL